MGIDLRLTGLYSTGQPIIILGSFNQTTNQMPSNQLFVNLKIIIIILLFIILILPLLLL